MNELFDPKQYWEERIRAHTDLHGTGHRSFDLNYNKWLYKTQIDCLDEILARWNIAITEKHVLDIGSGTGFYVEYFYSRNAKMITGLDITEASTEYLQNKFPGLTFITTDISDEELPILNSFHIISAMGILYHIVDQERFQRALRNICELLLPGGYLLITDSFKNPIFPSARHARLRPLEDYQQVLEENNLKILKILPLYYFLNRSYIPWLGPWFINTFQLGEWLYRIDRNLRNRKLPNGRSLKILVAVKEV